MEGPGEMIRRAAKREMRVAYPSREQNRRTAEEAHEEYLPPPPVSRHGSYTALMRSHDRVHTRHIAGKG